MSTSYYKKTNIPTIAGDSALFVEKFNNQPGLFVKRVNGKELTDDEKRDILFVLSKVGINVCHNQKRQEKNIDKISNIQPDKDGLFYIGNLRNGQSINAKCSIVIIGNVEKGASVYSQGNIVITGSLDGIAKAGCRGKENAFVYSLISGRNI